jgi:hypothetical protein
MWCPAPLPEGEQHRRKLRSDKYKPLAGCLLEFYEFDSSVEADEDTGDEAGDDDARAVPDAGGACRPYSPGTYARKDEDGLLLEFPCNPTRTRSV